MTRMPRLTSLAEFTYGTSFTSKQPERISRSYPSSRSRLTSALRFIGRCDIKDHPVLHEDTLAFFERALRVDARAVLIGDGVEDVRALRRRRKRELDDLVERHLFC